MEKQLIVGVDPGTSVGLAFLDVDGNVLGVSSSRNSSIDETITKIASGGRAVVIATDKAIAPPFAVKLSSLLGARLFSPDHDLPVEKKRELASKSKTSNDHERDSLAAAIYAYYKFQNKIRRIEKQVQEQLEGIKARVIKGEKVSDILSPGIEDKSQERELLAQISSLRKEIRDLRSENESLKRARPPKPSKEIIREAAKEAKELMKSVGEGKITILLEVPSLVYLDIKGIPIKKGDFILCRNKNFDNKGLRFLESRRVGAIISPRPLETIAPSCTLEDIVIISWEGLFFAEPQGIENACGRRKEVAARDLEDMLRDYKKGRR